MLVIYRQTQTYSYLYTCYSGYKAQFTKAFADFCQRLQFRRPGDVVGGRRVRR